MGIVGLPNVGKSSLFNVLTKAEAKCENYPFCTIDPNDARVPLPDERWQWLCDLYQPASKVPSYLEVVDIAGLVKGASEGAGLGNKFLSHISAVDGIYHVIRVFEDEDITHVEGNVDAIRDLEIISTELRLKDLETVKKKADPIARVAKADPTKRTELAVLEKILKFLEEGKDVREGEWNAKDVEILQELLLITAKPIIYLVNLSEPDYLNQKNKWLGKVAAWVKEHSPGAPLVPICVTLEQQVISLTPEQKAHTLAAKGKNIKSQLEKIITVGYNALSLINFFTCGSDEVRAWPLQRGTKAPQAAGTIHSDFEAKFIRAEVMTYHDLRELGSESAVKAAGKYRTEGKAYEAQDGDIMLFKHGAGGAGKKK